MAGLANAGIIPFGIQSDVSSTTVASGEWFECSMSNADAGVVKQSIYDSFVDECQFFLHI
ncbi:hypothetical protein SAMN05421760_101350 [Neptunomonas antarctica]|uniref:Uncharacterized protein n=1 Tax=Neptunomonas antarctica TaxID=619304 RepID=A0A1N7IZ19_9GAMM|nr:hypothetical protein SAMN05421760_101350 [Neptunomonas antarctica]